MRDPGPNKSADESQALTVPNPGPRSVDRPPGFAFTLSIGGAPPALVCDGSRAGRYFVGKSRTCDLCLPDPSVSRRHVSLEVEPAGLHIVDLDSTNGVSVNGVHVKEAWLKGGESLVLGGTELRVAIFQREPAPLGNAVRFGKVIGASPAMRRLYPLCERLAKADIPIVIEGESGTGKEVLAESLHEASARRGGPFVIFDCAAVAPTLVESALFGHERGAFTGAASARRGAFEAADKGTLFLDELGELPLDIQPRLLGAIARGAVQRVGSNEWTPVDVRIIAATRRDLDREVQEGRFREDLYYRLAVGRIELPPLRARVGDVLRLAKQFYREVSRSDAPLPPELAARIESYAWPGNVRELENVIGRWCAIGDHGLDELEGQLDADSFHPYLEADLPLAAAREKVVKAFERRYIERVLARHGGNVSRAAASSGLARRYFQLLNAKHRDKP
ncbi:MAG: sigma 54-interacting transcriptional regulator [Labilithrix sp.]